MGVSKVVFAALFLSLTVSVVNAYTVVMRDGRRVEIPNEFTVTNSTLTYGVGKGIQVTMQLNTVDIAATERANREARGALLSRANAPKGDVETVPQNRRTNAARSITNSDLEKYRRARLEGEREREELGMPSVEDRQREVAEIEERTAEQVRSMREQEDAYWRGRADELRVENEAQLSQRPEDTQWSYSSLGGFPGFFPSDNIGFGIGSGGFNRFRRFSPSPFDGFLATPITPFPSFPFTGRRLVFTAPGARIINRGTHMRHR